MKRQRLLSAVALSAIAAAIAWNTAAIAAKSVAPASLAGANSKKSPQDAAKTETPIKHLVVIFQENVSFDHYFATYPNAANPPGEPFFEAAAGTPVVNNLAKKHLLTNNPNFTNPANGSDAADPFRLDRTQANTADQSHGYTAEQEAYDGGKMDLFPKFTGKGTAGGAGAFGSKGQVMGYFDGNTVTAIWNYAQHFAMSDNAYTDTYGPSTPGALEVFAAQTNGAVPVVGNASTVSDGQGGLTLTGDTDPANDVCSSKTSTVTFKGKNVGDLLNASGITWGSFYGGFNLQTTNPNGTTGCGRSTHSTVLNGNSTDYVPHHIWTQYFPSTANPTHARPSSLAAVGYTLESNGETLDPANHNYDLQDFYDSVQAGNFPSVTYIKMPSVADGHPGNSDPIDEQQGVVNLVNFLQQQPDWKNTAIVITYDDSDGWYDHDFAKPKQASFDASADQLDGAGVCGKGKAPKGLNGKPVNGRCGPGTRIPFMVISPYAKANYVSDDQISQASVVRFIEDNWLGGTRLGGGAFDDDAGSILDMFDFSNGKDKKLFLDPTTGAVTKKSAVAD
jgi:phospholipase C